MDAVMDLLRQIMPYVLPVLLVIGQKLKQVSFFSNKLIPWALIVLNVGRIWLIRFGFAVPGTGEGEPLEPVTLAVGAPMFALIGVLGLKGAFMTVVGFGAQVALDHFFVNKAHKGLKYRAMFKAAEAAGLVNKGSSSAIKAQVRW